MDTVLNGGKTMIHTRAVLSPDPSAVDARRYRSDMWTCVARQSNTESGELSERRCELV